MVSIFSATPLWVPKGSPRVRDQAQAAMKTRLASTVAWSQRRLGFTISAAATSSWNQPATANSTPSVADSAAWIGTMAKWTTPAPAESAASATRGPMP